MNHGAKYLAASFLVIGCIKETDTGSTVQYRPAPAAVIQYSGHESDCSVETMSANSQTTLGGYALILDNSWGQGVEIFLENQQDPMSVACYHPRRRIAGRSNSLQGAVAVIDGTNPQGSPQISFQAGTENTKLFKFVNFQNKTYIAYEETPGGCAPSSGSTTGSVGNGCIVWGYVKADRRIRLVNASCLGGYRISGAADPANHSILFNQNSIRDLRGHPVNNCFVLTRKQFAKQPPTFVPEWDYQPSQPGFPGGSGGRFNPPGANRNGNNGWNHGNANNNNWPPNNWPPNNWPPNSGHPSQNGQWHPGDLIPGGPHRDIVKDVIIDTVFTIGQYKLCRDASPSAFELTSGLACRFGGFLSSSPLFGQCIRECRRIFEEKQWQLGKRTGVHFDNGNWIQK